MYIQILRLAIVAAACSFAVPAMGQHTGFINSGYGLSGAENCGRKITQQYAESLWAGYCTEGCAYQGGGNAGGCGLFGKCGGGGLSGGGGGCNNGCFGYPTGGGGGKLGGCTLGSRHGGGGCKLKGLHSGGGGCGCKLKGLHSGGGFGKLKGLHGGGCCKLFGGCKKFGQSAQQCGTSGAYFEEAVGYEYGTSGMQSCVSCNSCGSFDSSAAPYAQPMTAPYAQPMAAPYAQPMAAPYAQPQSVLSAPAMAEPVVGAIETLN